MLYDQKFLRLAWANIYLSLLQIYYLKSQINFSFHNNVVLIKFNEDLFYWKEQTVNLKFEQ